VHDGAWSWWRPKLVRLLTDDSLWSSPMSVFKDPEIYRIVLESMQTGLYMVDRDQRIQFWNEGAEKITGYFRQDVVGHFCPDLFPRRPWQWKSGAARFRATFGRRSKKRRRLSRI